MAKPEFDPRLTPARDDLAAAHLKDTIDAPHYATAKSKVVTVPVAQLYAVPDRAAMLQTELLLGERFDVYEEKDGWVWGQAQRDGYVGYVSLQAFGRVGANPDHQICVPRTPIFADPDLKAPVLGFAHGNSCFACARKDDRYLQLGANQGWIFGDHCAPMDQYVDDWVLAAEGYEHAPYVWGGRSSLGLDCSSLVQNALMMGGIAALRDSDMQEKNLGVPIETDAGLSGLLRGDLIFWKGHVGIMLDAHILLHANAHHMMVAREPLAQAVSRIEKAAGTITAIRRL
jgi:cell wall-associated NlpC family hydrolase